MTIQVLACVIEDQQVGERSCVKGIERQKKICGKNLSCCSPNSDASGRWRYAPLLSTPRSNCDSGARHFQIQTKLSHVRLFLRMTIVAPSKVDSGQSSFEEHSCIESDFQATFRVFLNLSPYVCGDQEGRACGRCMPSPQKAFDSS